MSPGIRRFPDSGLRRAKEDFASILDGGGGMSEESGASIGQCVALDPVWAEKARLTVRPFRVNSCNRSLFF